nr:RNA-binding cell elongation regulator Jag/EloR [Pontibacillus yanchengensis]
MGAAIDVKVHRNGKEIVFELIGSKIALLIGKRGQTLNALQYLAQLVINQRSDNYHTAIVDAEGYRERRKNTLTNLANRLAEKAIRTNSDVALEAMPSYERKIIHTALQNHKNVKTYSDGTEPHRHVVIRPE